MSGLVLKLKPGEEVMINGVLVENVDRDTRIRVKTSGANVLRMREALAPEEATTPLRRAYYIAQLAATGQLPNLKAAEILTDAGEALFSRQEDRSRIADHIESGDFYPVMQFIKRHSDWR